MNNSWMVAAVLAVAPLAQAAPVPSGVDAFLESPEQRAVPQPSRLLAKLATVAHVEPRLGVPTFVWGARPGPATSARLGSLEGLSPEQAARRHLFELSELYRLSAADVAGARVGAVHDTGFGGIIVSFRQSAEGVEVFRDELSVLMTRQKDLVAMSGHLAPSAKAHKGYSERFALTPQTAASVAFQDLTGEALDPAGLSFEDAAEGGYSHYRVSPAHGAALRVVPLIPLRTRPVLFELADSLEPGFYVELKAGDPRRVDSRYFSYVVSAVDGRVLFRNNLTHDASFSYRTFADTSGDFIPFDGPQGNDASPHPTGLPDGYQAPFVAAPLVTLDHAGLLTNDPWLPAGATITQGNNVDAYGDVASPDGYGAGDVRPDVSSPDTFDYAYDVTLSPGANLTQRKASVVNLFFVNNFLHDWFYDEGFNELSGNAQTSNLGRGGLQGDSLFAEGQDYSGKDNSNIQVPADGAHPQMQMYVFTGNGTRELAVTSPASIAGSKNFGLAEFGPAGFNIVADLWQANDATAPLTDACGPLVNGAELVGKVALIDRGNCTFAEKVAAAQSAGALAVIIANNQTGGPMPLYGSDPSITIPAMSVSQTTGTALSGQLTAGTVVSVRMVSAAGVDRDGTLDNAIVAHEWGHYISNRLIGNANGLNNNQGGGMGEGWGDFHSLLMEAKETDTQVPSNANWGGVFGLASYTSSGAGNNGYYYGIRRVPYSVDFAKNALTYKHIQDGVRLPTTAPVAFGSDGSSNSEVHASGEVWATMLWECYVALLRASPRLTFTQAQSRMTAYLVASYKLTPGSPTFLEARDALLAAALAADPADFVAFGQAFARRGAGVGATGPDRASTTHLGVV
ncbi:MAG: M36 family metallopeptidase, partial [Myxococcaceae bacterium]